VKVLAIGATGTYAGLVVPALVARGVEVRALVHDPAKADIPRAAGAREVVHGDLGDRTSLDAAMAGMDGVFLITPAFAPDATRLALNAVESAVRAGVRKVVYSGVYHPSLSLVNHAGTRAVEEALYRSELAFVVLQPAMFLQGLAGAYQQALESGTVVMPWSKHSRMTYVDYRDVADVVATAFTGDTLDHGTFELAAPGTHDRVSIAALMSEVAGRELTAEDPNGLPPGQPEGLTAMFQDYDRFGLHGGNALVLRSVLRREPRGLKDFLTEQGGHV